MKLSCLLTIGFMHQATSFLAPLSQRAGRVVSPRTQSLQYVGRAFSPSAHRLSRQQAKHHLSRMSETAGDTEPAAPVPLTDSDASPERKQEILDVLSAVIDPGEKGFCL